jgi:hypothetical protein
MGTYSSRRAISTSFSIFAFQKAERQGSSDLAPRAGAQAQLKATTCKLLCLSNDNNPTFVLGWCEDLTRYPGLGLFVGPWHMAKAPSTGCR